MSKSEKTCMETINQVKKFLQKNKKQNKEVLEYIERKLTQIKVEQNIEQNKSAEYIDKLVNNLQ